MEGNIIKILGIRYRVLDRDPERELCSECAFSDDSCRIGNAFLCDLVSLCKPVIFKNI